MPKKSKEVKRSFALKHWRLITAVVSVAVLLSGLAIVANEQYVQGQISAANAAEAALELGQKRVDEVSDRLDDLELAILNAEEIAAEAKGKTLETKDIDALLAEIEASKEIWIEQKTRLLELTAAVTNLKDNLNSTSSSAAILASLVRAVSDASKADWEKIVTQVAYIGSKITSVVTAQALWKTEQDSIAKKQAAAEKAAAEERAAAEAAAAEERMAKEKVITPVSTITEAGGQTEPSAPAPPAPNQEVVSVPIDEGQTTRTFIENYVRALAPNSFIKWVSGMCAGYYVCGLAWVGGEGSTNETPARIELDSSSEVLPLYRNSIGISVLVHEAAHARQWFRYGNEIITESAKLTVNVPPSRRWPNGVTGKDAVEYMADCMTIQNLGYSTGVYARSCSAEQLEEARLTW